MEFVGWVFVGVMGLLIATAVGIAIWETYKILRYEFGDRNR